MKHLINTINPKRLFKSKKSRDDVSRSDPSSFSSSSSASSSSETSNNCKSVPSGVRTPTSVLPSSHHVESSDWSTGICLELAQAFQLVDRDGKVKISRRELEVILNRVIAEPPTRDELLTMLCDADGEINVEEFGSVFGQPACGSELRDTFNFFDTDHDGRITAEELLKFFTSLGDDKCTLEDCRRMIAEVDENKDGFVCFEDFCCMMGQQQQQQQQR